MFANIAISTRSCLVEYGWRILFAKYLYKTQVDCE